MDIRNLVSALCEVESGGKSSAVGDDGNAYGILQIHKAVIDDVNRIFKKRFVHDDAFDPSMAREICSLYLQYWGGVYSRSSGSVVTMEALARIWNGGPHGWKKDATVPYWEKVKKALEDLD